MRSTVMGDLRLLELPDLIADCERRINAVRAEQVALIDEFDRTFPPDIALADAVREEIGVCCTIPDGQAHTRLQTARALARRLPLTREAMAAGRLSLEHAAAMARATSVLTVAECVWVETEVLDDPRAMTAGQLGFRARQAAAKIHPPTPDQPSVTDPDRSLTAYRHDASVSFSWVLPTADAEVVTTYLDATSQRQGRDDVRPGEQRRAEALLDLVRGVLDSGTLPAGGDGRRPHVELLATADSLRSGINHGAETGGRFVLSAQLRELACDADVRLTTLDPTDRTVLDQGRSTRVVSARLRARLAVRDAHCRFPGCDVRAPRCRAHHIQHWVDDGPTDAANLLLLCERHHHAVHGGWHVQLTPNDETVWTSPAGQRVSQPHHLELLAEPEDLTDPELGEHWIRPWWELLHLDTPPDTDPLPPTPSPRQRLDGCPF